MSVADAVATVLFAAVVLYAVFGGADFGSGVWDLTAGDAIKGAKTRRLIDHAIGPVWEANHVWLVFVLVYLWTGFPDAFALMMRQLGVPFWLAGLGIVARGSGFAFRKYAPSLRWAQIAGTIFATASLMTPFFLGTIAGAVASGDLATEQGLWAPWLGPLSLLGGVLAMATCTFLAGVLLTADAKSLGDDELADELAAKSLIGALATGLIALFGIPIVVSAGGTLLDGLVGQALPLVLISGVGGLWTVLLLRQGRYGRARLTAAIAVACVVLGWGVAQYPWVVVDSMTIDDAAGARPALVGLLVATGVAAVLVVPPLVYLFSLANSNQVGVAPQVPRREA